ncbi:hypothetical protein LCGC14_1882590 [marine sediment metagenome]|uniref:Uncharacterized protein n=1 Tax=marine sediment metagenome TaxID=412755 RepID=A0A0F9GQ46_9ZZZZ
MKRPYLLYKRGNVWYYRFTGEKIFLTTGQKTRSKAEYFIIELLKSLEIR